MSDQNSIAVYYQLAKDSINRIFTKNIPEHFVGRSYGELFDEFYKDHGKILLGLMKKEPELEISSIFAADSSGIDQFIQYALTKSKRVVPDEQNKIRWNPSRESIIQANDHAVLMA